MAQMSFYKMSGSGNDFVIIDNRERGIPQDDLENFSKKICSRKDSVGADGLILLEDSSESDFKCRFFNADGSEVPMCGNGSRCIARFAYLKGLVKQDMVFEVASGRIRAQVFGEKVRLFLPPPSSPTLDLRLSLGGRDYIINSINTGVPHVVKFVSNLEGYEVQRIGRQIRFHDHFKPEGTNVNFVERLDHRRIRIRTYERGVENETLACGTGALAASIVAFLKDLVSPPVKVETRGGETLIVYFRDPKFEDLSLEGRVSAIYEGRLWEEG